MDELKEMRVERDAGHGDRGRRHWNNGWRIVPTAEGAEARVYWIVVDVGTGKPYTDRSGYYDDKVRQDRRRLAHQGAGRHLRQRGVESAGWLGPPGPHAGDNQTEEETVRTRNLVVAIALVGAGMAIGWISAPGNNAAAAGALMSDDYTEIEQLYWRYNHGADFRDGDLFVSAFADDAVFHVGQQTISGREELMAWARGAARGADGRHPGGATGTTAGASCRPPTARRPGSTGCWWT